MSDTSTPTGDDSSTVRGSGSDMVENRRKNDIDDGTYDRPNDDDFDEYKFYAEWFAREPLHELLASVERTHEAIWLLFLGELQSAVGLLYKSLDKDARITGYLRGYRAVDSYDRALTHAVVEAFAAPFLALFDKPIKPLAFFHRQVLDGVRARAFDEAFRTPHVRGTIASFYGKHADVRNHVVHDLKVPTHDEFRSMLLDAKAVYDLADHALHPHLAQGAASHVRILGPEDYSHDDYRVPLLFGTE